MGDLDFLVPSMRSGVLLGWDFSAWSFLRWEKTRSLYQLSSLIEPSSLAVAQTASYWMACGKMCPPPLPSAGPSPLLRGSAFSRQQAEELADHIMTAVLGWLLGCAQVPGIRTEGPLGAFLCLEPCPWGIATCN